MGIKDAILYFLVRYKSIVHILNKLKMANG